MNYFYASDININSSTTLSEEESTHVIKVLRFSKGDEIYLLDGKGKMYLGEITKAHHKHTELIVKDIVAEKKLNNPINLYVAYLKKRERMEWLVEKAVELGVGSLTFFSSAHTEKSKVNFDRINKVALSAMKQSGNLWLPNITDSKFSTLVQEISTGSRFIAYCETAQTELFAIKYRARDECHILIGPEGDFSPGEVELAKNKGFEPVSLGELRLRTETAAIFALSQAQTINQAAHL